MHYESILNIFLLNLNVFIDLWKSVYLFILALLNNITYKYWLSNQKKP